MTLRENCVIKPGIGAGPIDWPHRILLVEPTANKAVAIALPGRPSKNGTRRTYVSGPRLLGFFELEKGISSGTVTVTEFEAPGHWSMSDAEYLDAAPTKSEKARREARLKKRDEAWKMISAIVEDRPIREIAAAPSKLRTRVLKQAQKLHVNPTTVYRILHIYLASGGVRSSLLPNTHLRGAPGRPKKQEKKLGRKSRVEKAAAEENAGFKLTTDVKVRLGNGYLLCGPTRTCHEAYLLTSSVYWSTLLPSGETKLWPADSRPTFTQFKYWGPKQNDEHNRKRRIGSHEWAAKIAAGSTQDQVRAVGQMAMIDSTSTDVYLTSMMSRLKKLPPMHRTIVKEMRSTAVIGLHVGWEDPSSATALQAVLSSAESKVELCARFGIDIKDEDWPYMLCKLYLADNGEMKAQFVTEAELEFRFGVEYVKSYSGQSKSDVENQHHTDHKRLDHKIPGTTKGRQRERGEAHPANEALWNYYEYMREFLRMIIAYNNEEVPHLAPTAMIKEGVLPTRINILKWMMKRNMRADLPCNVDQLRAFTLPSRDAVMTKTGIHLLMPDGIRHVPQIRFFAPALKNSHAFEDAVKNDCSVAIKIKGKGDDLSGVWFALPSGLTRIPNVKSDDDFMREATLVDHIHWTESEDLRKDKNRSAEDQGKLDTLLGREAITLRAKREVKAEQAALPKKISKQQSRSQLRKNRDEEMTALRSQDAASPTDAPNQDDPMPACEQSPAAANAMENFMQQFH